MFQNNHFKGMQTMTPQQTNQRNTNQPFNKNAFNPPNSGMSIYNPTYDQFVIKPPDRNKTHGRISEKLVIDSRDRDYILYPKPNKYRYELEEEYKDVISVELVLAEIPNTVYNIYDKNNQMILSVGEDASPTKVCKKFVLDNGEYSNESFLNYLNGSKGNIFETFIDEGTDAYFNFYQDPDTHILKIQSNKPFSFDLDYSMGDKFIKCNQGDIDKYYESIHYESIDRTIGFKREKHVADTKFDERKDCDLNTIETVTVTSSGPVSTSGYDQWTLTVTSGQDMREYYSVGDYLECANGTFRIVEIVNKETIVVEDFLTSGADPAGDIAPYYAIYSDRAFDLGCPQYVILDIPQFHYLKAKPASIADAYAVIPLDEKCKTIVNSGQISLDKEIKYFNPPLARLNYMDINFLRYDGSLVDFKGNEHMLAFRVTCLNQPGKYNNFNENVF